MIALHDIHKSFDGTPVLRGVSLLLEPGQSLVVIGASGSGKSVLMRSILGLERLDAGAITLDNAPFDKARRREWLNGFGMLFQGSALFDSLPVWQNVAFRLLHRLPREAARTIAIDKLERVGLDAASADRYPAELSGGMQKRAALARAIADDPKWLFFDEPTTGLDPVTAQTINRLIRDLVRETGATALTITHDLTTVRTVADSVALLKDGRIAWHGSVADMRTSTHSDLTRFIAAGA